MYKWNFYYGGQAVVARIVDERTDAVLCKEFEDDVYKNVIKFDDEDGGTTWISVRNLIAVDRKKFIAPAPVQSPIEETPIEQKGAE